MKAYTYLKWHILCGVKYGIYCGVYYFNMFFLFFFFNRPWSPVLKIPVMDRKVREELVKAVITNAADLRHNIQPWGDYWEGNQKQYFWLICLYWIYFNNLFFSRSFNVTLILIFYNCILSLSMDWQDGSASGN